jgi:glycosyltransferase involved in cell wall biosynthesis
LPVVLKVLGSDVKVLAKGRRLQPTVEALCGVDAVIAVSEDLARDVVRLGAPRDRVHVVPEGLDKEIFARGDQGAARARLGLPPNGKMILFVGNLLQSKGAVDVVQACAQLRDRGIAFYCRMVGQGSDAAAVERLIRTSHLGEHVSCVGARPHAELADWFRASDVVTLPSYSEGIPNVLREAISCGKPFVSTPVGGIPEITDPSFGILVPAGSIAELAEGLARFVEHTPQVDPNIVSRINISWAESARRLAGHLEAVVDSGASRVTR